MVAFAVALGAISLAVCIGMFVMFRAGDEPDPDVLKVRCVLSALQQAVCAAGVETVAPHVRHGMQGATCHGQPAT